MELFEEYIVHLTVDSELGYKFPVSSIYDKPGSDESITNRVKVECIEHFYNWIIAFTKSFLEGIDCDILRLHITMIFKHLIHFLLF